VSLSSDGQTVAISAGSIQYSPIRIYHFEQGIWVQIGDKILGNSNGGIEINSINLSKDASTIAIGGRFNNQVRVFQYSGGSWIQQGDNFGILNGTVAITEVSLDSTGNTCAISLFSLGSGRVAIYKNIAGDWIQLGDDIYGGPSATSFGYDLSLSSNGDRQTCGK
jgi:WD40 repeat protein